MAYLWLPVSGSAPLVAKSFKGLRTCQPLRSNWHFWLANQPTQHSSYAGSKVGVPLNGNRNETWGAIFLGAIFFVHFGGLINAPPCTKVIKKCEVSKIWYDNTFHCSVEWSISAIWQPNPQFHVYQIEGCPLKKTLYTHYIVLTQENLVVDVCFILKIFEKPTLSSSCFWSLLHRNTPRPSRPYHLAILPRVEPPHRREPQRLSDGWRLEWKELL